MIVQSLWAVVTPWWPQRWGSCPLPIGPTTIFVLFVLVRMALIVLVLRGTKQHSRAEQN